MAFISAFFAKNRLLARAITPDHVHEANVFGAYYKIATLLMSKPDVNLVVDVGAGKRWHLPAHYKKWYAIELIGLDIASEEMTENHLLDKKFVCDVCIDIPLDSNSVDLIMVSSGVEHFENNEAFLRNAYSILRPGGFFIAQFPSRYAPFAILNRILPQRITKILLRSSMGETADELGFKTHYDRTNYSAFRKIVIKAGFEQIYHLPGYWSSSYAEFFIPVFILSYIYDTIRYALGIKEFASYHLWVLRKPSDPGTGLVDEPFKLYAWK